MPVWATLKCIAQPEWILEFNTNDLSSVHSIGRQPSCSLVISDPLVSGVHVTFRQKVSSVGEREIIAEDSSSNGTVLDGEALVRGTPTKLTDGCKLMLPSTASAEDGLRFEFCVLLEPDAQNPPLGASLSSNRSNVGDESIKESEMIHSDERSQEMLKHQQEIIVEASRLAANIYTNDSVINNIFDGLKNKTVRGEIVINNRSIVDELKNSNDNLILILQNMVASMRLASDITSKAESISVADKNEIFSALQVERFQAAVGEILSVQSSAANALSG